MAPKRIPLPPFRTILFATDLSENSRPAFEVACALAQEEATRLIVLYVDEPVPFEDGMIAYGDFGIPAILPHEAPVSHFALREQLARLFVPRTPITVEYQVRSGRAVEQIVQAGEETGCQLLVMGTQGRSGFDRLFLGSVAEAVIRRAPSPILTVRPGVHAIPKPLETIVCATDFSPHAKAAVQVARELARSHGARLVLTHVVEASVVPSSAFVRAEFESADAALDGVRRRIEGNDLKFAVEPQLRNGDPASEILAAATSTSSDMIVMGTHGRSGLDRFLMGSVAETVMRQATCPVLTIKWSGVTARPRVPVALGVECEPATL